MIDPVRVARAIHLTVDPAGHDRFEVTGGSRMHVVQLTADDLLCDCEDVRATVCKHRLAVRLWLGDAEVLRVLRTLVPHPDLRRRRRVA